MQRAAALVSATSDRRVDLGLEGDDFYVQFADALIEPASETSSDHDELDAAWRGSWPRPVGPPPTSLRLAVGVLVVNAISTASAADMCAEADDQPISGGLEFRDYTQAFLDDPARGAALLAAWQACALGLAADSDMAHPHKRRRTAQHGIIAAAADFPATLSAADAPAASLPAASGDSGSGGDDNDSDDGSSDSDDGSDTAAAAAAAPAINNTAAASWNVDNDEAEADFDATMAAHYAALAASARADAAAGVAGVDEFEADYCACMAAHHASQHG